MLSRRSARLCRAGSLALALAIALAIPGAGASRPSELISGPAGLAATQTAGALWHRLEITLNNEVLLSKRLRMRDRGGEWKMVLQGQPVRVVCKTINGYSLELDCMFYGPHRLASIVLPFDGPPSVTSGPEQLSAQRTSGAVKEDIAILWNGESIMDGSLWLRDSAVTLKGRIDGQRARTHCQTQADFTRVIDCHVYTPGRESVVAQLRVPLF